MKNKPNVTKSKKQHKEHKRKPFPTFEEFRGGIKRAAAKARQSREYARINKEEEAALLVDEEDL